MKLIIDIAESYYKDLLALELKAEEHLSYEMEMIRNGIPLEEHCESCIYYPTETEDD